MTFSFYNRNATEKFKPYRVRAKDDLGIHQSAEEIGGVASGGTNASFDCTCNGAQPVSVLPQWMGPSTAELAAETTESGVAWCERQSADGFSDSGVSA